jgi:hypothetical protein
MDNTMSNIKTLDKKIERIKLKLQGIGDMHPGSLSKQFNICGNKNCKCKDLENPKKHGPYFNLSFVCNGKSSSRFIKAEFVPEIKKQLANYKLFKKLTDDWKTLAAERAKLKIDLLKNKSVA